MKQRLFIGIDLPPSVKLALDQYADRLIKNLNQFKKEPQDKFHITLKFLGSTEVRPEEILGVLNNKLKDQVSFAVTFTKAGIFVNTSTLLMVDVKNNEELLRTYHKINNESETLGFPRDRRAYHPHVTLARSNKILVSIPKLDEIVGYKPILVSHITLFESKLTQTGSTYTKVGEVRLGGNSINCN